MNDSRRTDRPEIICASRSGFCAGVKSAVDKLNQALDDNGGFALTIGPIVHNPGVVSALEKKGARVIKSAADAPDNAVIVVRAHGLPEQEWAIVRDRKLRTIDGSCGKVKKIHALIREKAESGRTILITGYSGHAETEAHISIAPDKTVLIQSTSDAEAFSQSGPCALISQTTFDREEFDAIAAGLKTRLGDTIEVYDTICSNMRAALDSASVVASRVKAMVVIGGRNSSNTTRLFNACAERCENTMQIETPGELDAATVRKFGSIGITAGASTPQSDIDEVIRMISGDLPGDQKT